MSVRYRMSSEKSKIFIIALSMVQYALTAQVVETVNFLLISTYFGARIIAYHLNLRRSSPRTVCGTHTIKDNPLLHRTHGPVSDEKLATCQHLLISFFVYIHSLTRLSTFDRMNLRINCPRGLTRVTRSIIN